MSYEWIYKLKPMYEDLECGGRGWYKLKWKPIKNGTYNIYIEKTSGYSGHLIGIRFYWTGARNGWGRSWDTFNLEIGLWFIKINFWLRWNIMIIADGPQDVAVEERRPLDLSCLKQRN